MDPVEAASVRTAALVVEAIKPPVILTAGIDMESIAPNNPDHRTRIWEDHQAPWKKDRQRVEKVNNRLTERDLERVRKHIERKVEHSLRGGAEKVVISYSPLLGPSPFLASIQENLGCDFALDWYLVVNVSSTQVWAKSGTPRTLVRRWYYEP